MEKLNKKIPLSEYPWKHEIEKIILWSKDKGEDYRLFAFDLCMSLAYIDATSGIESYFQYCPSCPDGYNAHLGFINLCSPCFEKNKKWQFQKAAKPLSGVLGKLSSEILLKFIEILFDDFTEVYSIGGVDMIDALLIHKKGYTIYAEVKSAPLLTYPILISIESKDNHHATIDITRTQLMELNSAMYFHNENIIPLGKIKGELWPFKPIADYVTNKKNSLKLKRIVQTWTEAKESYITKQQTPLYYLANASGKPPIVARQRDEWPSSESISDSKTSVGMDRTDDIKKGIYQVLKIGVSFQDNKNIKTAIISNLPAYRHGSVYVDPFIDILWGNQSNLIKEGNKEYLLKENLRYVFDYLITLTNPIMRDLI